MLVNDIEKNRGKNFEKGKYSKFVIKQAHKCGDLFDTLRVILRFNKVLSLDLT